MILTSADQRLAKSISFNHAPTTLGNIPHQIERRLRRDERLLEGELIEDDIFNVLGQLRLVTNRLQTINGLPGLADKSEEKSRRPSSVTIELPCCKSPCAIPSRSNSPHKSSNCAIRRAMDARHIIMIIKITAMAESYA